MAAMGRVPSSDPKASDFLAWLALLKEHNKETAKAPILAENGQFSAYLGIPQPLEKPPKPSEYRFVPPPGWREIEPPDDLPKGSPWRRAFLAEDGHLVTVE